MKCRHPHDAPAIALVHLPHGCLCFPYETLQWLCEQHLDRLDSIPHKVLQWMDTAANTADGPYMPPLAFSRRKTSAAP
jgi:hypothetical protein